ncbi:hypothetical protein SS37A_02110 [Methylocystis iwaonis]|uniref:Uncharacterized protein n=1 Tax=Methylocystis iwaonis TaxID=2885079 RepID=A0ABM8E455_9HYPH|nr:hypothetical protein SS37A_02110 [Methylocystis iwaonis]
MVETPDVAFVAEIQFRLDKRQSLDQRGAPTLDLASQCAAGNAQRLPPLRLRLGIYEIGKRLRLGEVELAIGKAAPRKFAGLSHAQTGSPGKGR